MPELHDDLAARVVDCVGHFLPAGQLLRRIEAGNIGIALSLMADGRGFGHDQPGRGALSVVGDGQLAGNGIRRAVARERGHDDAVGKSQITGLERIEQSGHRIVSGRAVSTPCALVHLASFAPCRRFGTSLRLHQGLSRLSARMPGHILRSSTSIPSKESPRKAPRNVGRDLPVLADERRASEVNPKGKVVLNGSPHTHGQTGICRPISTSRSLGTFR